MSELSKILLGSTIVGASGVLFRVEVSERDELTVNSNTGLPFFNSLVPSSTFVSTAITGVEFLISHVKCMGAFSKIIATIIERVVIFVIALFARLTSKDCAVHLYGNCTAIYSYSPSCVETMRFYVPHGAPIPFRQPMKILGINYSVLSLRQGDKAVRLIERLSDFMSLDSIRSTLAAHWSSSQGLLQLNRYFTGENHETQ